FGLAGYTGTTRSCTRGGKIGFGLCKANRELSSVELNYNLTRSDLIVFRNADGRNVPSDFRDNGHDVSVHRCIVSRDMRARVDILLPAKDKCDEKNHSSNAEHYLPAFRIGCFLFF